MFKPKRSAEDFAEEIKAHLALEADELKGEGLSDAEAQRRARSAFGSIPAAQERFFLRDRWNWWDSLRRNLRYGLRSLLASPGFTFTAILTLALGIGANTAVFSVMNAVLLRSLPVADPQRVVFLQTSGTPNGMGTIDWNETFSYAVYDALRHQTSALSDVIAIGQLSTDKLAVRLGAEPETASANMVSGNFFSGLGVKLVRGRGFTAQDEDQHAQVLVLSYHYWSQRFAKNPDVVGKTIYVKGVPFTIVGVAAEGFEGTEAGNSLDFWIPLQNRPEFNVLGNAPEDGQLYLQNQKWWCLHLMGRLAPGVSRDQALSRLQSTFTAAAYITHGGTVPAGEKSPVLSFNDAKNFPGSNGDYYAKPLRMLMGMVGLILLIAVTNVVMLLMARNASRQREFSLRLALGARRSELLRQLLTESLLLVAASGVLAWGFAEVATRTLGQWAMIDSSLAPDQTVLLFTLAVLAASALLFGFAPFRVAVAGGAGLALKTSAATSGTDAGKTRIGKIAVALQMALCLVLLVAGGLLVRTLGKLQNIPLGMQADGLVVFGLDPRHLHSQAELVSFYQELERRLRVLPGVESVTVMASRLGSGWSNNSDVMIDGKDPILPAGTRNMVRSNDVGPDFFHTLGVPILLGREFTDADNAGSLKVAIVSELLAQDYFPHKSPLGHQINGLTIIGVVKNNKYREMNEEPIPMAWWDYAQAPGEGAMTVEMRVHGQGLAIIPTVQKLVARMDPDAPLIKPALQREQFETTISQQLMFARLGEFFGLLAVALVATGLYGTLAYRVNMRTAEIGVRMAVGAARGQVVWMILRDSLLLTAAGAAIGFPLATLTAHALAASLYGITPWDTASYLVAIACVVMVALAASAVPAARAASVNPITALRAE
jgi:predicted permease